jgi:hypothetical protein
VLTVISCPDCDVPAEITERFSLPSTDGAVEHIVVRCAAGHCFRIAADRLPSHQQQELATRIAIGAVIIPGAVAGIAWENRRT